MRHQFARLNKLHVSLSFIMAYPPSSSSTIILRDQFCSTLSQQTVFSVFSTGRLPLLVFDLAFLTVAHNARLGQEHG